MKPRYLQREIFPPTQMLFHPFPTTRRNSLEWRHPKDIHPTHQSLGLIVLPRHAERIRHICKLVKPRLVDCQRVEPVPWSARHDEIKSLVGREPAYVGSNVDGIRLADELEEVCHVEQDVRPGKFLDEASHVRWRVQHAEEGDFVVRRLESFGYLERNGRAERVSGDCIRTLRLVLSDACDVAVGDFRNARKVVVVVNAGIESARA